MRQLCLFLFTVSWKVKFSEFTNVLLNMFHHPKSKTARLENALQICETNLFPNKHLSNLFILDDGIITLGDFQ
jgi:hypothetical protein